MLLNYNLHIFVALFFGPGFVDEIFAKSSVSNTRAKTKANTIKRRDPKHQNLNKMEKP